MDGPMLAWSERWSCSRTMTDWETDAVRKLQEVMVESRGGDSAAVTSRVPDPGGLRAAPSGPRTGAC